MPAWPSPPTARHSWSDECDVDLTVAVPAGLAVTASADSGDITASDLDALTLHADSGNLQVNGGSGLLHLSTDSGQITGVAMDASDVNASANSGSISLDFARAPADVSIQDNSGDVTVTVPSGGPAYAVSAHSDSGSTSVEVPTDPTSTHDISISVHSGNAVVDPREGGEAARTPEADPTDEPLPGLRPGRDGPG